MPSAYGDLPADLDLSLGPAAITDFMNSQMPPEGACPGDDIPPCGACPGDDLVGLSHMETTNLAQINMKKFLAQVRQTDLA